MLRRRRRTTAATWVPMVVLLVTALWMAGCGGAAGTTRQTTAVGRTALRVLAAETFLADIAQNVAGDKAQVQSLMPLGVDPHSFEPTPADIARVAECDVLIVNGAGFEAFLDEMLKNAGGQFQLVDAAGGLASRTAREGEAAVMSDADLAAAMCAAVREGGAAPVVAGADASEAASLPAESGLFKVTLARRSDGTYSGYLAYATDEPGDFQFAFGPGTLAVLPSGGGAALAVEKDLPLDCDGASQGQIIELESADYVLALSGFTSDTAGLLVGPAGGGHHHDGGDPHFWLDPTLVVRYAENIRHGLSTADPLDAAAYGANAAAYIAALNDLDAWIKEQVAQVPPAQRLLVTNHESFGYFADRYGFSVVGTIMPSVSTGATPSAQQLARLVDTIEQTGARAIFLETGSNPQLAKQVAAETGVTVVTELYSHSVTEAGGGAPTYLDMMRANTQAIVGALK